MSFKPLLAGKADLAKHRFPTLASPKLDGIRTIVINGVAMSRTLKPIPNAFVQSVLGRPEYEGLDGELIVGPANAEDVYRTTNSGVMSRDGEPDFTFYVFDTVTVDAPFSERYTRLEVEVVGLDRAKLLPQSHVHDLNALLAYEEGVLDQGYEGVMLRSLDGRYKQGRSTTKEGILLKLKRFESSEAIVLKVVEQMHNANEATINALGHTERSSHKENLVPKGTMGALSVRDIHTGIEFEIGTGFTQEDRDWWWSKRDALDGLVVTYDHFAVGVKDKPRFPSYKGLRSQSDIVVGA